MVDWYASSGVAEEETGLAHSAVSNQCTAQGLRLNALHVLADGRHTAVRSGGAGAGRLNLLLRGCRGTAVGMTSLQVGGFHAEVGCGLHPGHIILHSCAPLWGLEWTAGVGRRVLRWGGIFTTHCFGREQDNKSSLKLKSQL